MFRRFAVLVLTLLLAACNLSVPQVTPTVAPTRTPTDDLSATDTPVPTVLALLPTATTIPPTETLTFTPSATFTPPPTDTTTATASATHTFTPTDTNAPTATRTNTPTNTPPPTNTPTSTPTFTPTNTDAPTATVTNTPLPTSTPLPTATNTLPPTVTPLPLFPTDTPVPTSTPPPAPTITLTPSITNTATNPPPPSFTAFPIGTATRQLSPLEMTLMAERTATAASPSPAPTLDVTPTFITIEAPSQTDLTPVQVDTTPQPALPTFTYTPQPTVALVVTLAPTLGAPPGLPTIIPINPQTRAFALSTTGGAAAFNLPHNDPTLFARNPLDPNLFASTDEAGNLYLTGTINQRLNSSPFMQDITPLTPEDNNAFVSAIAWSPDGTQMAFIVAGRKLADDGVWVFDLTTFDPLQLLVDCPTKDFPGCAITREGTNPDYWESRWLKWSPTNDALLVGVHIPQENRDGIVILPRSYELRFRDVRPPVLRYQFATWGRDGQRVLVSGAAEDGHVLVGWLHPDGTFSELVYDAEANGLWMGYANEAIDNQIYALGAPGDRSGPREPLRIYNMTGQAMTPAIGSTGVVERVEWSPDGTQVFVETGGQQFIATISGSVREITGQVAGARAVNWVEGNLPPGSEPTPAPPFANPAELPSGVIAGSLYQPGQQLRVYVQELNIRSGPSVDYEQVRSPLLPGEYVAILAGPVNTPDGITWWRVLTADGAIGWIAGAINGAATLGS